MRLRDKRSKTIAMEKVPKNALFHCEFKMGSLILLQYQVLLLLGNFSIAQEFLAFQMRLSQYCIPLGMGLFVSDYFSPQLGELRINNGW